MASIGSPKSVENRQIPNFVFTNLDTVALGEKKTQIVYLDQFEDYPDLEWQKRQLAENYQLIVVSASQGKLPDIQRRIEQILDPELVEEPLVNHFHASVKVEDVADRQFYRYCRSCHHFARYFNQEQVSDPIDEIDSLALIFCATDNSNGAFSQEGKENTLKDLVNSGYEIVLYRPISSEDFNPSIQNVNRLFGRIDFLSLWGHGVEGRRIRYTRTLLFDESMMDYPQIEHCLKSGAVIILQSCKTGQPYGLAQYLSKKIPCPVFAPKIEVSANETNYSRQAVTYSYKRGEFDPIPSEDVTACFVDGINIYERDEPPEKSEILERIPLKIETLVDHIIGNEFLPAVQLVQEIENDFQIVHVGVDSELYYGLLTDLKQILGGAIGEQALSNSESNEILKSFSLNNPNEIDEELLEECFSYVISEASKTSRDHLENAVRYMFLVRMYQKLLPKSKQQKSKVRNVESRLSQYAGQEIKILKSLLSNCNHDDPESASKIYKTTRQIAFFEKFLHECRMIR